MKKENLLIYEVESLVLCGGTKLTERKGGKTEGGKEIRKEGRKKERTEGREGLQPEF